MIKRKYHISLSLLMVGIFVCLTGMQPPTVTAFSSDQYQSTDSTTSIPTESATETSTPATLPTYTSTLTAVQTLDTPPPPHSETSAPSVTTTSQATSSPVALMQSAQSDVLYAGTFDDSHTSFKYTAGWISEAKKSALNGSHKTTSLANEKVSFTFYGGKFHLLYTRTNSSGTFLLTIDGKEHSFKSSQSSTQYRARWLSPSLPVGYHTVVIQKQDKDKKPIYVDGFIIYGPISSPVETATATNPPPTSTPSLTLTAMPTSTPTAILPSPTNTVSASPTFTPTFTAVASPTLTLLPSPLPSTTPTATLPSTQSGATYYVSASGNDASPGNETNPWRTIQKAANTASKGDTVIVLAGSYPERVMVSRSGEAGAPITFQAQGTVVTYGFTVTSNYISIRGFEITNTPNDSRNGWGIWVNGSGCLLENNYVHDATRGGIVLFVIPGKETVMHDCIVRNNRLYRNAFTGIEVHGRNNLVEGNEIWGTIQYHPSWLNPPNWVDADGMRFHGSGHIIRRNNIHDIHYGIPENRAPHIDCFQTFSDGSYHEAASNIIFEQNICLNMQSQSSQAVGKAFMIEDANGLVIRNNILQAYRVLQAIDSNSLQIVNNIFTNRLGMTTAHFPSMITLNNTPNSLIKNNSFFEPLSHVIYFENSAAQQGVNIGNNNAYRSDGKNVQGTAYPNDLWNVNPLFVNAAGGDFHLQAGSPLIDRGVALSMVPSDYDGKARPQGSGYDIGAFEWMP